MRAIGFIATIASLLFTLAVGSIATLDVCCRPAPYLLDNSYLAPVVQFMAVGETGYVRQYDLRVSLQRELRIDRDAAILQQRTYSNTIRVMRMENGVCINPVTIPRDLKASSYLRHDLTLPAAICDIELFMPEGNP